MDTVQQSMYIPALLVDQDFRKMNKLTKTKTEIVTNDHD
jgi:hypothetical protein